MIRKKIKVKYFIYFKNYSQKLQGLYAFVGSLKKAPQKQASPTQRQNTGFSLLSLTQPPHPAARSQNQQIKF
ncbi:hypothetical protein [Psychroflexus aestuariivivens]|uniref:hypothetical protein n=1 Tax=Psychroflexus aestuariivivens TaxID=1795040 RepID=UPI000FDA03E9|nr:hypothetical protein [Psychroflexus aestuariivivens]